MVEVQRPFSMPSRVVLDLPIPKEPQPPLPQCPSDLEIYCPRLDRTNRGDIVRSLIQLGLQTPPRDMSGVDHNAQISKHGGTQYKSIPAVKSYPAPYQAHTGNHLNGRPVTQPRPTYHHGNQHPNSSPNENAVIHQQPSRRQNSGDGNSIATYLQIPESISSSKGSLSDFTARITCLFWFESSFTLHRVEESKTPPMPTTPLVAEAMPSIGFRKWVTTILSTTQVTQNVILLALLFIYRLKKLNPTVKGKLGSEFRLLTVALMLGNKFLDDNTYTNKTWAEVSGISVQEINIMELEFLSNMRYSLYTSTKEWDAWHVKLGKFWTYFDKASRTPLEVSPRTIGLPSQSFHLPPTLPSPPTSQHPSPLFMANQSNTGHVHPLSMPLYLGSTNSTPVQALPEVPLKPFVRKRSYDESDPEPAAKRFASSQAPSATSSTTMTPSTLRGITPTIPIPRLPVPNLSISTNHNHLGGIVGSSSAKLPLPPVRAMSNVYPGISSHWPQNGMLPSSQPPSQSQLGPFPPMNEQPYRTASYSMASATSSPTTGSFPQSRYTPTNLSPSGFSSETRNSPYKPLRGVNTLLVPPPSASMNHAPENVRFNQMHYQPLGKPLSEQKTGILPYSSHDYWSSSLIPHPPQPQAHTPTTFSW